MISNILALAIVFSSALILASGPKEAHSHNRSNFTRRRNRLFSSSFGDLEEAHTVEDFVIRYQSTESSPIPTSHNSDDQGSCSEDVYMKDITDSEEYVQSSPTNSALTDASFDPFEVRFKNFMAAIGSGNTEQVKLLLRDVSTPTTAFCNAPLKLARLIGNQEIVDMLMREPTVIWSLNSSIYEDKI